MDILITLCARGGSKGIPRKNIRDINDKPLINYSIEHANAFASVYKSDIALSTDSIEIKEVAKNYGLITTYIRPAEISSDTSGKIDAISHLLQFEEANRGKKYDYILDLDISSPLRSLEDLLIGFRTLLNDPNAANLFSVSPANRNPYFNMVELQPNGYYGLIKKGDFVSRQTAPEVYELNASFYFYRRAFFEEDFPKTINNRSLIHIMEHICFDLDHPIDLEFLEFLLVNNKLDFEL